MDARASPAHESGAAGVGAGAAVVRNSRDTDVPAMLAIYLRHIRSGVDPDIVGKFEMPDTEDLRRRRKTMTSRKMPHMVAENRAPLSATRMPFPSASGRRIAIRSNIRSTFTTTICAAESGAA